MGEKKSKPYYVHLVCVNTDHVILNAAERYLLDRGYSVMVPRYINPWMAYQQTAISEFDSESIRRVKLDEKGYFRAYIGHLNPGGMVGYTTAEMGL